MIQVMSAGPQVSYTFAQRFGVFIDWQDDKARLACRQDVAPMALAEVQRLLGFLPQLDALPDDEFRKSLSQCFQTDSSQAMQMVESMGDHMDLSSLAEAVPESADLLEQEGDAPVIRLINALIAEAVRVKASDIHIETFEQRLLVRFRVDGVLREMVEPRRELAPLLVSRIKVMAKLDIAEKRVPQDGRIAVRIGGHGVDLRVSTLPAANGERVVMRLLDQQAAQLSLANMQIPDPVLAGLRDVIQRPHGIVLVTGPTGSGKTTTLYAALSELNHASRNILTVEDPIEYQLPGIGQTQVNNKAEMTFAKGLRAMLRQDPDVVMVGEIRDLETADIAVQASLTGHLVLSTLHTNTSVGAITRLKDMGVEPFLLASGLQAVLAQRLLRVLCKHCKQPYKPDDSECALLEIEASSKLELFRPQGCDHCAQTGYQGRSGIYEWLLIDEEFRRMIHRGAAESDLRDHARRHYGSLRDDGVSRVLSGQTSLEELLRVTQAD